MTITRSVLPAGGRRHRRCAGGRATALGVPAAAGAV